MEGVAVAYKLVRYSAIPLSFRVPHGTTDPSDRIAANARLVAKNLLYMSELTLDFRAITTIVWMAPCGN